ncbi:uncharacterized protein LAJ45_07062 [Morchella importuna]|uniref:Clavaminate synthase-like protein n=1 Tax=Morchella conica CCBAS932 TaxID=1392247 RepID=A0A3N4KK97_9PEZI|nr:uncharacterized protein LAJ45_07062 [Morchella importuna]KAH8148719.1 hypothetical protein LAJ45_07062 [Morchella importuna]RPB10983.1 Clavaminate synthase-like protein [Morchella conica CCBAS932]
MAPATTAAAALTTACTTAISTIHSDLTTDTTLSDCGLGALQLHRSLTLALWTPAPPPAPALKNAITRATDLLRLCTDKLHTYPYRDVPLCWRRLYTDASVLKAVAQILLLTSLTPTEQLNDSDSEIVRTLDMALIMAGAPGNNRREIIEDLLEKVDVYVTTTTTEPAAPTSHNDLIAADSPPAPKLDCPIERHGTPLSLEGFTKHLLAQNTPLIMAGVVDDWPALTTRPWASSAYLLSRTHGGKRLVPVEVGRSYTNRDWAQRIMTFREFMNTHVLPRNTVPAFTGEEDKEEEKETPQTGYLAQHTLFHQIPPLRNDILIPDYCYTTPPAPPGVPTPVQLEAPLVNAWFGPAGTISPLHTDPYSNILCQVLGRKYVRLYAPSETTKLFPRGVEDGGVDMSNTSSIDIERVEGGSEAESEEEKEKWRVFKEAKYVERVLERGEGLYIPAGWWHYVRSLDTSFSVSFWWN